MGGILLLFEKRLKELGIEYVTTRPHTPTYNIIAKSQLSVDELNDILEKINDLNNYVDGDIIINYKGKKKFANKNDVDKIFWKYFTQN